MDRPPPTTTESLYEPACRSGHAAVGVDGKVFLWGGWMSLGLISGSILEMFNMETGQWEQRRTTGRPPRGAVHGAYTTIGNKAYHFGGSDGGSRYNAIHSLDLSTMQWVSLKLTNKLQGPSRKGNCGMVAHGDDELVVFGGLTAGGRYTDELHVYNLRKGSWSTPHVTGTPPPPCARFSFTKYGDHHAVLFGGWMEGRDRVSDVYTLNMETWVNTLPLDVVSWYSVVCFLLQHWSKLDTHGKSGPVGREGHTACLIGGPLMGSPHPQLLVIGGFDQSGGALEDAWVLDLNTRTWRKVDLPHEVGPRWYHTATVVSSGSKSVMVVEFGGCGRIGGDIVAATASLQIASESRPGEPPTWRVVEVVSTEHPKKWRKKVDQLQKIGRIQSLLKKRTTIPTLSASMVLFGPPRVGKSTVLRRVLRDPSLVVTLVNSMSTPVAEKPIRVLIKKAKATMATLQAAKFLPQNFEDEKLHLARHSLREASLLPLDPLPIPDPLPSRWKRLLQMFTRPSRPQPTRSLERSATATLKPPSIEIPTNRVSRNLQQPHSEIQGASASTPGNPHSPDVDHSFQTPDDIVRSATSARDLKEVEELLEGSTMLHILDTGGQPEFLDVLSMLLTGPSLNILTFNLNEGLQERYVVEYVSPEGATTVPHVSSFTVEEVLFQAFASVSYTAPPTATLTSGPACAPMSQSATIIVGTHKDKVSDEKFEEINNTLQKKLKCFCLSNTTIIRYPNPRGDQPPFNIVVPVDNTSPTDPGIPLLQDLMNEVIQKHFEPHDTLLSWLMFHLSVRSTNARVLSFQQCATIARQCGIEDDQELKLALWYLSHQCGIFRYYPDVKGLEDIVICDLQVLFDCISNLLSSTFNFGSAYSDVEVQFRNTGRCPLQHAEKLLKSCNEIPPLKLLNLLEHLHLLSPIHDERGEVEEYFIPCILPSYEVETLERPSSQCTEPAPLLITFESGYCPLGLFHSFSVHLASPNLLSDMKWRLCEGKLFRNNVSFYVGEDFDRVTLISRPMLYEVWIDRGEGRQHPFPLPDVCNQVRTTIDRALDTIKSSLNYTLHIPHHISFYCQRPNCHVVPHPATPETTPAEIAVCSFCKDPSQLSPQQHMWYGEGAFGLLVEESVLPRIKAQFHDSVDATELGEDDLYDILAEVTDVTKWFDTGLALGLKYSTLEKIKIKNREDVDDCRRDMLVCWLRRMDRVNQTGLPSWRSLVRALSSAVAYYPGIVKEIGRKHPAL